MANTSLEHNCRFLLTAVIKVRTRSIETAAQNLI
jgi:hypothetical protein